jgi:hypothetical protein
MNDPNLALRQAARVREEITRVVIPNGWEHIKVYASGDGVHVTMRNAGADFEIPITMDGPTVALWSDSLLRLHLERAIESTCTEEVIVEAKAHKLAFALTALLKVLPEAKQREIVAKLNAPNMMQSDLAKILCTT